MIVSETPNRWNSRTLLASMLLCAAVVLPVGMTFAQDYDAVERRLGEAVAEGELSLEQANAMMGALRRSTDHDAEARRMRVGAMRVKTGFIDVLEKDARDEEQIKKLVVEVDESADEDAYGFHPGDSEDNDEDGYGFNPGDSEDDDDSDD